MEIMKYSSDSRRSFYLILIVVLICFALVGYLYNFSRDNRLLISKHESLSLSYKTCRKEFEKCDNDLQVLVTTGEKLQALEKMSVRELDAKKIVLVGVQNKLQTKTSELDELQKSLETEKRTVAKVQNAMGKMRNKLSDTNKLHMKVLEVINMDNGTKQLVMTKELQNSIISEIIRLKASDFKHEELKAKHATLLGVFHTEKLKKEKEKEKLSMDTENTKTTAASTSAVKEETEELKKKKEYTSMDTTINHEYHGYQGTTINVPTVTHTET